MRINYKKAIAILSCLTLMLAMSVCFASGETGSAGFVTAMTDTTTGITGENLWTAITPFVGIFVTIFIFAFAYGRLKKSTKSGSKGKFNM